MRNWRIITVTGAITAVSAICLIQRDLWMIATALTLAYVALGIGLILRNINREREARRIAERNRNKVFKTWLSITIPEEGGRQ